MKSTKALLTATLLAFTASSAGAALQVYEPFNYNSATLSGQGGALGTTGTWNSNDSIGNVSWGLYQEGSPSGVVLSGANPSVDPSGPNPFDGTYNNLAHTGGFVGYNQGGNNLNADIALDASVTASFGTTASTTWISYVSVRAWDRNEEHANLVLSDGAAPNGSRGDAAGGIGTGISGFGTGGGPTRNNRTDIYPMFYDQGQYSNHTGDVLNNAYSDAAHEVLPANGLVWTELNPDGTFGAANIVVMKIEWNADTSGEDILSLARFHEGDVISEAAFNAQIAGTPNLSSVNWGASEKPDIDETTLDTLTFMGVKYFVDEIRLGTTFADVTPVPEPSSLALIGLGGLLIARRRRD